MPVSYFPAKGRTFPWFKCSAALFSAVPHRITWCSISFAASQLCYVDEKGWKWPVCLKYKWKSSWQSCCCSQFLAFSCRTENSDTWKSGCTFPVSPGNGSFQQPPKSLLLCALCPKFSTWAVFVLLRRKCQMKVISSLSLLGLQNWANSWAKYLGQGVLPFFAPFSTAFHKCWISFPVKLPCSHLVSCHQNELSREQLMDILMVVYPVTLELKQIYVSNMPKTLKYMEVIQPQICMCSSRQIWTLGKILKII